jgi:hypothetical protein
VKEQGNSEREPSVRETLKLRNRSVLCNLKHPRTLFPDREKTTFRPFSPNNISRQRVREVRNPAINPPKNQFGIAFEPKTGSDVNVSEIAN